VTFFQDQNSEHCNNPKYNFKSLSVPQLLKHGNSSAPAVQDDIAYEFIMTGFVLAMKAIIKPKFH